MTEQALTGENQPVPEGWEMTTLGQVTAPSTERVEPTGASGVPYLSLEHIESHTNRIIGRGDSSEVRSTKNVFRKGVIDLELRVTVLRVPIDGLLCSG